MVRGNLPPKEIFLGKAIPNREKYVISEYKDSGGNAHLFKAFSEEVQQTIACKIIPRTNLRESTDWKEEAKKANRLSHPAVVKCDETIEWAGTIDGVQIDCVGFCYTYIDGISLRKFIRERKDLITIPFVETFLKTILELLHEMESKKIPHGDLHAGNILVENAAAFQLVPRPSFKVIDFGVGTSTTDGQFKDDFQQIAAILFELIEAIDFSSCPSRDKFAYNILNDHLLNHFSETDQTRDPLARNPSGIFGKLNDIDRKFVQEQNQSEKTKLVSPFDFLNCEQIGESHSLLQSLYSNLFLGLEEIENLNNLVLTGPRGCGKSTVFKSLSLKHRLNSNDASTGTLKYFGIYYRCWDDIYYVFPRYEIPTRPDAFDLPLHFFTATLILEVLETVASWSTKHHSKEFAEKEPAVTNKIWDLLELTRPMVPENDRFSALCNRMRKERSRAAEKQRKVNDPKMTFGRYFSPGVLLKVCDLLREELFFLESKPFFFFIDDYSDPKITLALQKNLNRLTMQRSPSCFFKISTESAVSFSKSDIDGKNYVEGREFVLQDLGTIYLSEKIGRKLAFLEDVFQKRLNAIADYPAKSLEELVGSSENKSHNEIAREIRKTHKAEWFGKETIIDLCSGDIHYIINLVGKMVAEVGGVTGLASVVSIPKIPPRSQNKAIRDQAGNFLFSLRGTFKHGPKLVDIVTAFGKVAHSCILHKDSTSGTGTPHQACRIEPLDDLNLSPEAQGLYNELLRYSVFIEDRRGKSRRGTSVPRLHLRRFLIPHFILTFSGKDSLELEPHDIETLLMNPSKFEYDHRLGPKDEIDPGVSQTGMDLT